MTSGVEVCVLSFASGAFVRSAVQSVVATMPVSSLALREHGPEPLPPDVAESAVAAGWRVRWEHDPSNPGFGAGNNALIAGSDAEWVLILNPDAEVLSWPFADPPDLAPAILGPARIEGQRPASHRGVSYRVRDEVCRSWLRRNGPPPAGTGFVSGAAMLVRRADFDRIGGFDPGYFLFYEDIDLCQRANRQGIPTHLADGWVVRHHGGHSTGRVAARSLLWSYESAVRFHARNGERVWPYRLYVVADSVARAAFHAVRGGSAAAAYRSLAMRALRDLVRPGR